MAEALIYSVYGRGPDGATYVSDGSILLRSDLVAFVPSTAKPPHEITADQIAAMLNAQPRLIVRFADLVPSRVEPSLYRTPDDVALAAKYVQMLGGIGAPIDLGTTGPRGMVLVRLSGGPVVGAVMPVVALPEIGTFLPPPDRDAVRGRVVAFDASIAQGWLRFENGREGLFLTRAMRGFDSNRIVNALADAIVHTEPNGALRVDELWPAGTPRPAAPPEPARVRWPSRIAFDGLYVNGLLGEFDGGTWVRLLDEIYEQDVPEPDEVQVFTALCAHYFEPESDTMYSRSPRAVRDGIFLAMPKAADVNGMRAAIANLAGAYGVLGLVVQDPTDIRAVHRALGEAFARAGRKERVYLIGELRPFVIVREKIVPHGPFLRALEYRPDPGAPAKAAEADTTTFLRAFASTLSVPGASIVQVASLDVDAADGIPAFTVHVLQRVIYERREDNFFIVTNGLRDLALRTTAPGSVSRLELATWSDRHDLVLVQTIARLGRAIHKTIVPGGAPFFAGQAISAEGGAWMGWNRVLLARMTTPIDTAVGPVDVLRALPITDAERDELLARSDPMGGWGFVTALENQGIRNVLARWYSRLD